MNEHGQLGMMDEEKRMQPVIIPTLRTKGIVRIYAGMRTSFALSERGELYCWGSARGGELGLGLEEGFLATPRRNRYLSDVKDVQIGRGFGLAVTYSGFVIFSIFWPFSRMQKASLCTISTNRQASGPTQLPTPAIRKSLLVPWLAVINSSLYP